MIIEIVIFISALVIAIVIIIASWEISSAIRNPKPKETMAKDLLGRPKKAQIVKKNDEFYDFLEI